MADDDEQAHCSGCGHVEPLWVGEEPKRVSVMVGSAGVDVAHEHQYIEVGVMMNAVNLDG